MNKKMAEAILKMIETERFHKWHGEGGKFDNYISGDMTHETKLTDKECREIIIEDIRAMIDPYLKTS